MSIARLIKIVTGVLLLSVLLPVAFSFWLARHQAEQHFMMELDAYTERTLIRTNDIMQQAKAALAKINSFTGEPCSDAHLQAMRRTSFVFRHVQEVVYLKNNSPLCSSLVGRSTSRPLPPPTWINGDNYDIWYSTQNDIGLSIPMVMIAHGPHMVLIDPSSFIDLIPFSAWPINTAIIGLPRNRVLTSSGPFDKTVWEMARKSGAQKIEYQGNIYLIHREPRSGIAVVAWASQAPQTAEIRKLQLIWMPAGILFSIAIAFWLLRLLRRLQSPRYRLQDGIKNNELVMHYQPIIRLADGRPTGAEALIRWPQPDGSMLTPDIFIPLAEQTGLIGPLTRRIVYNVLTDLGDWLRTHPQQHISINISAFDLHDPHFVDMFSQALAQHGVAPHQLALEITERGFADPALSGPVIARLRAAGHKIYIDDFGTGYSSLSYLEDLDVDILKIDKSFVDALEYKTVTPHIIEMAKTLRLEMVAEGVESQSQALWLREHGVQYAQGWLYSKALPAEVFITWCSAHGVT
ncbi:EAL domain-containing protein [Cronobacter turicensis]|uniref:EAL domain-containing protein n=1 Tax=Cronobacter turicensis TaxID=413502 RepID=UPI0011ABD2B6|nr:EAL domain-containing protein [Cronobacter turicensis]EKY3117042.1 EAL domain-containing protein [Cronobacter turicensis]ELU8456305.1 EAL domain-containing protein [Cronobacter turicensis]ELY4110586.1 EAL domain-containing protein [Cronobacter turicensis]ELY4214890.1 EAL domain-containing protein [Cronobacter turicensis]EMA1793268.1 EAL domain-containing protein [Cronobacter turicensis]